VTQETGSKTTLAEAPGGGRQDHEVMREAAGRPVAGPASTDLLAAGGGLEVPGREIHAGGMSAYDKSRGHTPQSSPAAGDQAHAADGLIPGERDASTLMHRQPGAVGGQFAGADIPAAGSPAAMDERTALEHAREGGGDLGAKPHTTHR
jgi:hypothetical protein